MLGFQPIASAPLAALRSAGASAFDPVVVVERTSLAGGGGSVYAPSQTIKARKPQQAGERDKFNRRLLKTETLADAPKARSPEPVQQPRQRVKIVRPPQLIKRVEFGHWPERVSPDDTLSEAELSEILNAQPKLPPRTTAPAKPSSPAHRDEDDEATLIELLESFI